MPGMIDLMQKPPALDRLEKWSRLKNPPHLADAITALMVPGVDLADLAHGKGLYDPQHPNTHLKKHWLSKDPTTAFWPDHDVAEIMRQALLRAFKLMDDYRPGKAKPIDFSWVAAPPRNPDWDIDPDPWEAYVWDDTYSIKVMFYTPFVKCSTATKELDNAFVYQKKPTGVTEKHVVVPDA
jgi:hypothetical protein